MLFLYKENPENIVRIVTFLKRMKSILIHQRLQIWIVFYVQKCFLFAFICHFPSQCFWHHFLYDLKFQSGLIMQQAGIVGYKGRSLAYSACHLLALSSNHCHLDISALAARKVSLRVANFATKFVNKLAHVCCLSQLWFISRNKFDSDIFPL